jgi:protein-tyrosine phosphatase
MSTENRILFLCIGNYRSRYAEELFNHRAKTEGLGQARIFQGSGERGSPDNIGPMSRFVLEALQLKAVVPAGATRHPQPCSLADFDKAQLVIALKEVEHRPTIERRFPELDDKIIYWDVDDVEFAPPSEALAMIDDLVEELILTLRR